MTRILTEILEAARQIVEPVTIMFVVLAVLFGCQSEPTVVNAVEPVAEVTDTTHTSPIEVIEQGDVIWIRRR